MSVLYVLMPLAILIVAGFVVAFVWAVRSGQLDDTDTPPLRVLTDTTGAANVGTMHQTKGLEDLPRANPAD